jgi:hypothetical protein
VERQKQRPTDWEQRWWWWWLVVMVVVPLHRYRQKQRPTDYCSTLTTTLTLTQE